jgi:hypothetical protein
VAEKLAGAYGQGRKRLRVFRAQVDLQDSAALGISCGPDEAKLASDLLE